MHERLIAYARMGWEFETRGRVWEGYAECITGSAFAVSAQKLADTGFESASLAVKFPVEISQVTRCVLFLRRSGNVAMLLACWPTPVGASCWIG
jgi:hypothetical protein